jgi:hypothetical protein
MNNTNELDGILQIIDQAYNRLSWHGTNLRGSVRSVSAVRASWRPEPERHNIWEIVVHAAYWKYAVWRRLTGSPRSSFPLKGSNWFTRPDALPGKVDIEKVWRSEVALLDRMHRQLREAAAQLSPGDLNKKSKGSKYTNFFMLSGIAAHDLYHAGQIQLLKKLWKQK